MGGILLEMISLDSYTRKPAKIIKIVEESPTVKSFYLKVNLPVKVRPGQFVMVWLPGYEEIPISPSLHEDDILRLTIAAKGETTKAIHKLNEGDKLIIRGPYGKGFNLTFKNYILIGGGYGVAPLIYALHEISKRNGNTLYVVGAKNRKEILFLNEAKRLGAKILVSTEDGSLGYKGLVADLLNFIDFVKYDTLLTCGPEGMMKRIYDYLKTRSINIHAQFSLERYIKCGIGICGSCVLNGLRVCCDGPVFTMDELENTDFGFYTRDPSGKRIPL